MLPHRLSPSAPELITLPRTCRSSLCARPTTGGRCARRRASERHFFAAASRHSTFKHRCLRAFLDEWLAESASPFVFDCYAGCGGYWDEDSAAPCASAPSPSRSTPRSRRA